MPKPNANLAGELAEALVMARYGWKEPEVEIKAWARHQKYLKIKLTQLEKNVGKTYVIVRYDRECHQKNYKRKCGLTVRQAFKKGASTRIIPGNLLIAALTNSRCMVRWVRDRAGTEQGSFYAYFNQTSIALIGQPTQDEAHA